VRAIFPVLGLAGGDGASGFVALIDRKSGAGAPHSKYFYAGGLCGKLADAFAACDGWSGRIRVNRMAIVVGALGIALLTLVGGDALNAQSAQTAGGGA
jgi:hypothetical protein